MTIARGFRRLADVVDELDATDVDVVDASIPTDRPALTDGRLQVALTLSVPLPTDTDDDGVADAPDRSALATGRSGQRDDQGTAGDPGRGPAAPDGTTDSPGSKADSSSSSSTAGGSSARAPDSSSSRAEGSAASPTRGASADSADPDAGAGSGTGTPESTEPAAVPCPECGETFESKPGMEIHRTKVHRSDEGDDQPVYRDPDALGRVYEDHDTFTAMRDALGVDVSAQTVRRNMIEHGIHDPHGDHDVPDPDGDAADPDGDPDPGRENDGDRQATGEEEELLADGSSLSSAVPGDVTVPERVTLPDLRSAVETADTLYDVQTSLDLSRGDTQSILAELNLLELVHGRVSTREERERRKDEIERRIRERIGDGGR